MASSSPSPQSLFSSVESTILPDPSPFFSPDLLSSPLPTNSFFQNLVLNNGDQPEYIHPYLIKSSNSTLSISYPSPFSTPSFSYQIFDPNLTISSSSSSSSTSSTTHIVSSFSDLGLTLHLPSSNLLFFLLRGSPFITFSLNSSLSISTCKHSISSFSSLSPTSFIFTLNNNQTWLLFSSSPLNLTHHPSSLTSTLFSGIIRIALLPNSSSLDPLLLHSSRYPISGNAHISHNAVEYKWETLGEGGLLMLANPLHLSLLLSSSKHTVLHDFKYQSMDGDLVAVIGGDSWFMKLPSTPITWHSVKGVDRQGCEEITRALTHDVESLTPISTTSSYFYGKAVARVARLALVAEEVSFCKVIPALKSFLGSAMEPWLEGTFAGNGFLYESKWRGLVTQQGAVDKGADFGFGVYNDHHYHLGYFVYAIAVLAKLDPTWGRKYRAQAYALLGDYFTVGRRSEHYARLRCFDFWKMHSWAGGLTEFADGRNQESSREAVNAYYAAALLGMAYGDGELISIASSVVSMEVEAARMWWHVREGEGGVYEEEFRRGNRMVGVVWSTKRDSGLWFAPPEWRECRIGIQVLPLLPVTEVLFGDEVFVKEVVEWGMPSLQREGVGEGWKGFVYALEGVCRKEEALEKVRKLGGFDDGNSLSNLLWWIHSRPQLSSSWFRRYCY